MIDIKDNYTASYEDAITRLKEILDKIASRYTKIYSSLEELESFHSIKVNFFEPESKLPVPKQVVTLVFKIPKSLQNKEFSYRIESESVEYPLYESVNLNYFSCLIDRIVSNKSKVAKLLLLHTDFESTRILKLDGDPVKLFTIDEQEDILSQNEGKFFCSQQYEFKSFETATIDKFIKTIWKTLSNNAHDFLEQNNFKLLFEYGKFKFSEENLGKLWKYCDYTGRGKVNYKEFADFCFDFIQCLRSYHQSYYKYTNNSYINEKIKNCVEIMNMHFREYDIEGNNEITYENLKKCLLKENEIFSRKEIEIILKQINPEKNFEYWKFDKILKILFVNYFDYSAIRKEDKIFNYLISIFEKQDIFKVGKLPHSKMKYALLIENKLKMNKVQIMFILYFFNLDQEIDYFKASVIIRDIIADLYSNCFKSQKTEIRLPQFQKFEIFEDVYDAHLKNILNLFVQYDKDFDRLLNKEEFYQFIISLIPFISQEEFEEMFNLTDIDSDGKICYEEFKNKFQTIVNITRIKHVFKDISEII